MRTRPLGCNDLYGAAMRVGRDHVASAVNTLVLAYAGAALPLLLLFALAGRGLGDLLTAEDVAQEVVRTLVGSIGARRLGPADHRPRGRRRARRPLGAPVSSGSPA